VYGEKLLMMDKGTVRNMKSFISKQNLRKSVPLVGFITKTAFVNHASRLLSNTSINKFYSLVGGGLHTY
jgi:hypothetical protein